MHQEVWFLSLIQINLSNKNQKNHLNCNEMNRNEVNCCSCLLQIQLNLVDFWAHANDNHTRESKLISKKKKEKKKSLERKVGLVCMQLAPDTNAKRYLNCEWKQQAAIIINPIR